MAKYKPSVQKKRHVAYWWLWYLLPLRKQWWFISGDRDFHSIAVICYFSHQLMKTTILYHYCCMILMVFTFFCRRAKLSSLLIKERTCCSTSPHMSCILQSRLYRIPTWLVQIIPLGLTGYESSDLFTWKSSYSLANSLVGA